MKAAPRVLLAAVVLSSMGLVGAGCGDPERIPLVLVDTRPVKDDPGWSDVCFDFDGSTECYEVLEEDVSSFGPVGGCVLVKFVGEGWIEAVRLLRESACRSSGS